ncbi:NAD-dependent epimerase/dehydratase family protein [Pseudodesulfovibrio methanolicus]|uniref:NAD(P)-dependent oxidoreductase n=1 Tax=Pseudodesulfovibrio methanolicus TaxID=3126690 RepID=A0ABZ2IS18_9BACT
MRILVTGATGFIGNHLVPALLARGVRVIATTRHMDAAAALPWAPDVSWRELDVFSPPPSPFEALGAPDRMVHLAWHGLPNYKDSFHLDKNLPADTFFLSEMIRGGLKHLLVVGTCFEYGLQEGELSETMAVRPNTVYGRAKHLLQERICNVAEECGTVFQWARLFYTYGKGQNPNSLFAQLQAAIDNGEKTFNMSGGQQIRDYLPVEELAEALASIVLQTKITGIINVCSGRNLTVQNLVEAYIRERKATMALNLGHYPYPDYEPFKFWGSTRKLERARKI